ncbi:MAG: hypothetical protein ACRC2S_11260 [Waterburya sp.]
MDRQFSKPNSKHDTIITTDQLNQIIESLHHIKIKSYCDRK